MFNQRIERLRKKMEEEQVDKFLIKSPSNLFYFSGFKSSFGYLLLSQEEALFFTDFRYIETAREQIGPHLRVMLAERKPMAENIKKYIESSDRLGFESNHITYLEYEWLQTTFNHKIVCYPAQGWPEEIRQIKNQYEIDCIASAQGIAEKALTEALNHIRPGVTEKQMARIIENYLYDFGAEELAFPTIVVSGHRASLPHGIPSDKEIAFGDLVTIDMGCRKMGYCSDMTRTFAVGSVEEKQRKIYNVVLEAQEKALAGIMAGKTGSEIDKISRDHIEKTVDGAYFGHGLGHSLGIDVHEAPALSPSSVDLIKENMVMTVEPGIYIPGFTGVRIEDLIVVKENGYQNLTRMNKELQIL